MTNLNYKSAGVDLDLYDETMRRLPALMQRTFTPRVLPLADAFAGLMRLNHSSRPGESSYRDPVPQASIRSSHGVTTRTNARANSQARYRASDRARVRANANSAINASGTTTVTTPRRKR